MNQPPVKNVDVDRYKENLIQFIKSIDPNVDLARKDTEDLAEVAMMYTESIFNEKMDQYGADIMNNLNVKQVKRIYEIILKIGLWQVYDQRLKYESDYILFENDLMAGRFIPVKESVEASIFNRYPDINTQRFPFDSTAYWSYEYLGKKYWTRVVNLRVIQHILAVFKISDDLAMDKNYTKDGFACESGCNKDEGFIGKLSSTKCAVGSKRHECDPDGNPRQIVVYNLRYVFGNGDPNKWPYNFPAGYSLGVY